jgi:single-stranded-DNA-specific exonuclease
MCTLSDEDLVEKMKIDIPLPVGYVDDALVTELETLEPYGIANPRPLFAQKDVPVRRIDLVGNDRKVLKLKLEGADSAGSTKVIDAVCFDRAEEAYEELKDRQTISILYQAGFNEYQGRRSVQLIIKDYM